MKYRVAGVVCLVALGLGVFMFKYALPVYNRQSLKNNAPLQNESGPSPTKTVQSVSKDSLPDGVFSRDSKKVYSWSVPIDGADPTTFFVLGKLCTPAPTDIYLYSKDNKHVYFTSSDSNPPTTIVQGADPDTFKVLLTSNGCAGNGKEEDADAIDKVHSYFAGQQIK